MTMAKLEHTTQALRRKGHRISVFITHCASSLHKTLSVEQTSRETISGVLRRIGRHEKVPRPFMALWIVALQSIVDGKNSFARRPDHG